MKQEKQTVLEDITSNLVLAVLSNTNMELATKISDRVFGVKGYDLSDRFMEPRQFTVGEYCPKFILPNDTTDTIKNLAGKQVYILLIPDPSESPEMLIKRAEMTAAAAKQNNADKVVLLATDLPHARQDRGPDEDEKAFGELNTVRLHARLFEAAGIDKVITTHEHSPRLSAMFGLEYGLINPEMLSESSPAKKIREIQFPTDFDPKDEVFQKIGRKVFESISPHAILADYLLYHSSLTETKHLQDKGNGIVLKAMDKGNGPFIDQLQKALFLENCSVLYCNKSRKAKNDPTKLEVSIYKNSPNFTTLDGKIEILADDGLDTGGTMLAAVRWSNNGNICVDTKKSYGTPVNRLVYFTHAWLGGQSHQIIQRTIYSDLPAQEFITTNTRPYIGNDQHHRFKEKSTVLRFAGLWADAILANELKIPLVERYSGFNSAEEQHEFLKHLYILKRHSAHFMVDGHSTDKKDILFYRR